MCIAKITIFTWLFVWFINGSMFGFGRKIILPSLFIALTLGTGIGVIIAALDGLFFYGIGLDFIDSNFLGNLGLLCSDTPNSCNDATILIFYMLGGLTLLIFGGKILIKPYTSASASANKP